MKKHINNRTQQEFKYKGRKVTAEFKALERKCNQRANKHHVSEILGGFKDVPVPKRKAYFQVGMLVTTMGVDIQRIVSIDDDGVKGKFECLFDPTNMYKAGDIIEKPFLIYYRITETSFGKLFAIANRCGWFIELDSLESE